MCERTKEFNHVVKMMSAFSAFHNRSYNNLGRNHSYDLCDKFVLNYVLTDYEIKISRYKMISTYSDIEKNIEIKTSIDEKSNLVFSVSRYGVGYV